MLLSFAFLIKLVNIKINTHKGFSFFHKKSSNQFHSSEWLFHNPSVMSPKSKEKAKEKSNPDTVNALPN